MTAMLAGGTLAGYAPARGGRDDTTISGMATTPIVAVRPVATRAAAPSLTAADLNRPRVGARTLYVPAGIAAQVQSTEPGSVSVPVYASPQRVPTGPLPDWRALVRQYDWPLGEAERVILCESSGNPNARNGPNIGLMQVNVDAHPQYTVAELLDPAQNIAAGYAIWKDAGGHWSAWSCQP